MHGTLKTPIQNSITTATSLTSVGTIGTGVWQGTEIGDAYVADNLTIDGGTVNNSIIGGSTHAAATFTTLTSEGDTTIGDAVTDKILITGHITASGNISGSSVSEA